MELDIIELLPCCVKARMSRRKITDKVYRENRMDSMNNKVKAWLTASTQARTGMQRRFYSEMAIIYLKRYIWYINESWKSDENCPRRARLVVEDSGGADRNDELRPMEG